MVRVLRWWSVGWVLWVIGALPACRRTPSFNMRAVDADLGLSMHLPEGYEAAPMGPSLRIFSPATDRKTRSPANIMLTVNETQPDLAGAKVKQLDARHIHYSVTTESGGSGGEGVRLQAWVASNGRFISLDSVVQPESGGDADFPVEWAILPTLRSRPGG